jgi:hypothetical protein
VDGAEIPISVFHFVTHKNPGKFPSMSKVLTEYTDDASRTFHGCGHEPKKPFFSASGRRLLPQQRTNPHDLIFLIARPTGTQLDGTYTSKRLFRLTSFYLDGI